MRWSARAPTAGDSESKNALGQRDAKQHNLSSEASRNTRPCVCQGSKENCRYCAGRGYVDAGLGLPASFGQKKLNIFGSDGKRRELRPNLPCPICGIHVTKLKRHIRKQHGGIQQGSLSSSAGE